jgi:DNA-directed RNA polymerase specialized sigma24 family protein
MERLTVAECEQVGWLAYEYCMRHYDQSRSQFTTFLQLKTRCLCLNILRDEHRHRKWEFNNIGGECFSILRVGGKPLVKLEDVADESEPDF